MCLPRGGDVSIEAYRPTAETNGLRILTIAK